MIFPFLKSHSCNFILHVLTTRGLDSRPALCVCVLPPTQLLLVNVLLYQVVQSDFLGAVRARRIGQCPLYHSATPLGEDLLPRRLSRPLMRRTRPATLARAPYSPTLTQDCSRLRQPLRPIGSLRGLLYPAPRETTCVSFSPLNPHRQPIQWLSFSSSLP